MIRLTALFIALWLSAASVSAWSVTVESLEYMADTNPLIGIYTEVKRNGREFTVQLEKSLRGEMPAMVTFVYEPMHQGEREALPTGTQRFLVSFQPAKDRSKEVSDEDSPDTRSR